MEEIRMRAFIVFLLGVFLSTQAAHSTDRSITLTTSTQAAHSTDRSITLITGDRVSLGPSGAIGLVQPRKGREALRFVAQSEQTEQGTRQTYVFPEDVVQLISDGRLDRELFNVSQLSDVSSDGRLPIIITYTAQARPALAASVTATHQLESINGVAVKATEADAGALWDSLITARTPAVATALDPSIRNIWLDRRLQLVLDRSVPQIGAPSAWSQGYQGEGIVVAVADSGVDLTHPDLVGRVAASRNFTAEEDRDLVGHGTHVASILAGSGTASSGKYKGVAPGATLISAKVCLVNGCPLSSIIEGIEWASGEQGAKVINLSLTGADSPGVDPLEQAINELTEQYGTLFVAAAGNSGRAGSVGTPSTADAALSVAAVDRNEAIAFFSSRGPREDGAIKPEISAPGVGIVAALASGSDIGPPIETFYTAVSGTSMATPHVAGAAALLSQRHPEWGPHQLKAVLIGSAKRNPALSTYDQGAGRVDVANAFATQITTQPSTIGFPKALWPHDDDLPVTRTITYTNEGSSPVTLNLRIEGSGPAGIGLPAGLFTVSPATLSISPGATASAQITADTSGNSPIGIYSGALIADVDGRTFTVPLAVEREAESYDVRVSHIGTNGEPSSFYLTSLLPLDIQTGPIRVPIAPGEVVVRLPIGRYAGDASLLGVGGTAIIYHAPFTVNGPMSIVFDARDARQLSATVPSTTATRIWTLLTRQQNAGQSVFGSSLFGFSDIPLFTHTIGGPVEGFQSYFNAQWADTLDLYVGTWVARGALITGPQALPRNRLSAVKATYAAPFPGVTSSNLGATPIVQDFFFALTPVFSLTLPLQRNEYYYSNEQSIRWRFREQIALPQDGPWVLESGTREFVPGRDYEERWNEPPLASIFPVEEPSASWAYRIGNSLVFTVPLFGDSGGHVGYIGTTQLELFANGQKIGESSQSGGGRSVFPAAAERTEYRLQASGLQSSLPLSTSITAAWTFTSEPSTAAFTQLPLVSLRFTPRLNAMGQAFRGLPFAIPITVRQLTRTRSSQVHLRSLRVEVSYDEGKTWQRVLVLRLGQGYVALLVHPKKGDYVSLRTVASDYAGNTFEETVIRAYALSDLKQ
jgi:subtilisin family serine protease